MTRSRQRSSDTVVEDCNTFKVRRNRNISSGDGNQVGITGRNRDVLNKKGSFSIVAKRELSARSLTGQIETTHRCRPIQADIQSLPDIGQGELSRLTAYEHRIFDFPGDRVYPRDAVAGGATSARDTGIQSSGPRVENRSEEHTSE